VIEGNERFLAEILATTKASAAGVIIGYDHIPQLIYEIVDNDGK